MSGGGRIGLAACVVGALALVGHQMVAFPGDFGLAMVWILVASVAAGLVSSIRIDPFSDDDGPGAGERRSRTNRRLWGDVLLVTGIQVVGAYAFALTALARGDDDETLRFIPLVLGLMGLGAWCLGLVAGLLVVRPLIELGTLVVRGVRGEAVDGRRALLALVLLTVVAFAVAVALAVDSEASGRRFVGASLPVLLTGRETDTTTVASVPHLWFARALLGALVAEVVLLSRSARKAARGDGRQGATG